MKADHNLLQYVKNQLERVPDRFTPLWKWRTVEEGKQCNGLEEGEEGPREMKKLRMAKRKNSESVLEDFEDCINILKQPKTSTSLSKAPCEARESGGGLGHLIAKGMMAFCHFVAAFFIHAVLLFTQDLSRSCTRKYLRA